MDKLIKSLNEQHRNGTLTRNTAIGLRVLSGESPTVLAKEYKISKQRICQIFEAFKTNRNIAPGG